MARNMKTVTRRIWNPATKRAEPHTMKIHPCEGVNRFGGAPCSNPGKHHVGDQWFCGFHHPDRSKRQVSGFAIWRDKKNGIEGPVGKPRVGRPRMEDPTPEALRKREKRANRITPITPTEAIAANFASAFSSLISEQVKKTLRELLVKED